MATCRELIGMAYRKLNAIGRGEDPSAEEAEGALATLQSLYDEILLEGVFGVVIPARLAASDTAEENTRIFNTTGGDITITLPEDVAETDDITGLTLDSSGNRPPRDFAVVSIAGGGNYLYSQPRGAWDSMSGLTLDDFAPLSERGADGLACLLALTVADDVPTQAPQLTVQRAMAFRSHLSNRSGVERAPVQADYF